MARFLRYKRSNDERDVDASILLFTHAIFLPSSSILSTVIKDPPNLIWTFHNLTRLLLHRPLNASQPHDVQYCVRSLRYLRGQPLDAFGVPRGDVTASLVNALAFQHHSEPSNGMQAVEEMSALCHELLASDLSETELIIPMASFARVVVVHFEKSFRQPSQQVIECLRRANTRLPDSHDISYALSESLYSRFFVTTSINDYEDAMAPLEKVIASYLPGDTPSPYVRQALDRAARLAFARFGVFSIPEYLDDAILRYRTYLGSLSPEDPDCSRTMRDLVLLESNRSNKSGVKKGLPELHSDDPEVIDLHSFSHLAASLAQLSPDNHPSIAKAHIQHLQALRSMNRITDKAEIEEGVKYCRLLLASLHRLQKIPDDISEPTHQVFNMSGKFLFHAFEITNNPEYLNESIDIHRDILKAPSAQSIYFGVNRRLITSLMSRYMLFKDGKDRHEIMQLYPIAVTDTYATVPDRFKVACRWARVAHTFWHSSTSTAYKSAMSLLQYALVFSPTLETQHFHLFTMRDHHEQLPLDYACYQVHNGQLKEAIETLERGRGLLWSEMRGLRTSIDQLCMVDSNLAGKFAAVNRDLEVLATSGPLSHSMNDGEVYFSGGMDPFGHAVMKQRKLLDERDSLIIHIRSLPGFEDFLKAQSFKTLRSAAARGPVIIINHCRWRSNIIILLRDSPPSLIATNDGFYDRTIDLRDRPLAARKEGLDSREYEDALSFVLQMLYDLVGRPVIQRLRELNVPEQSRIWWCPTSVFCFLPLHAMGPIRSDGHHKLYFSDLYIPSYTPTLSALIESHKTSSHSFEKPSILLVAQPDESMPGAWEEISHLQHLKTTVTILISKHATPPSLMERLPEHRFAHFSCHGILETGRPFDASFKLYDGERLTLLDIVRSRLPSAEFAFLSACHTAEVTEESIADEGLHLAAAVQYSGFRSVVGTMWEMADIDGQFLAKHFYGSLFSGRWEGLPYYERTAEALRDAVRELRRKKMTSTERWVNFVHYGA
jgi:CHAT domain-containing protein